MIAVEGLQSLGVRVSTRKPDPHPARFVVVSRIGGGSDDWATLDPRFLIECFAENEVAAEELAMRAFRVWLSDARKVPEVTWAQADPNLTRFDDPDPALHRFQFTGGLKLKPTF